MVDGLHGEVPGHELDDGLEAVHGGPNGDSRETRLSDGGIDDAVPAVLLEEPFGDFVGALVLANLLAEQENLGIMGKFFVEGQIDGLADSHLLGLIECGAMSELDAGLIGVSKNAIIHN